MNPPPLGHCGGWKMVVHAREETVAGGGRRRRKKKKRKRKRRRSVQVFSRWACLFDLCDV